MSDQIIEQIVSAARERYPQASRIKVDAEWTRNEGLIYGILVKAPGHRMPLYGDSDADLPSLLAKIKEAPNG
jgi:hypothetical protein